MNYLLNKFQVSECLNLFFHKINFNNMNEYDETLRTLNKIADLYQEKFMDLQIYNDTYKKFCDLIEIQNATILEIGCGPGNITKQLLSIRPDLEILGIDYAPTMIELATKNNPSAKFKTMDCRDLHKLNTSFDAIICGFCLPYLNAVDCQKMMENCYNLLSPKGILYLSFVEGQPEKSTYQTGRSGDRIYFNFHHLEEVCNQLRANNFKILHTYEIEYQKKEKHTILIAEIINYLENSLHLF